MDVQERYFRAEVLDVGWLTPVMRRVVLGGQGLQSYRSSGVADEWFRFLFPTNGRRTAELPTLVDGHWVHGTPAPQSRWYTVRDWDPAQGRLTADLVVHGHGVATQWARAVRPGDEVVLSSPVGRYGAAPDAEWELLIADLTGLPAVGRILAQLPEDRRVRAILEAPNEECALTFETRADLHVSWIHNATPDLVPSALAAATRSLSLWPGPGYVWMAGEAACSRDIRRYFRHELKWPSSAYDIVGYWRPGAESYLKRYTQIEDEVARIYQESVAVGRDQEDAVDEVLAVMELHGL